MNNDIKRLVFGCIVCGALGGGLTGFRLAVGWGGFLAVMAVIAIVVNVIAHKLWPSKGE